MRLNIFLLAAQVIITSVALFILYRLIYIYSGEEQLGIYSLLMAFAGIIKLSEFGVGAGIIKFVAQSSADDSNDKANAVIETSVIFVTISSIVTALIIYFPIKYALRELINEKQLLLAQELVPYVLALLVSTAIHTALQSALDGLGYIYIRSIVVSIGAILATLLTYCFIESHGLFSAILSQTVISLLFIIYYVVFLKRKIKNLTFLPNKFCRDTFFEMWKYNISFQGITALSLIFDPVTKGLIGYYGGLVSVGYYELANKLLNQLKNLITLPNQAIVPTIAKRAHVKFKDKSHELYKINYAVVLLISVAAYGLTISTIPAISIIWINDVNYYFVTYSSILAIGYTINGLANPAYFYSIGTGYLRVNLNTHLLIAVLNLILGCTLGYLYGGIGVISGWAISLSLGSVYLIVKTQGQHNINVGEVFSNFWPIKMVAVFLFAYFLSKAYPILTHENTLINVVFSTTLFLIVTTLLVINSRPMIFLKASIKKGRGSD